MPLLPRARASAGRLPWAPSQSYMSRCAIQNSGTYSKGYDIMVPCPVFLRRIYPRKFPFFFLPFLLSPHWSCGVRFLFAGTLCSGTRLLRFAGRRRNAGDLVENLNGSSALPCRSSLGIAIISIIPVITFAEQGLQGNLCFYYLGMYCTYLGST